MIYGNLTTEYLKNKVIWAINVFIALRLWIRQVYGIKFLSESESLYEFSLISKDSLKKNKILSS